MELSQIKQVAVLGLGTMGPGLAMSFAGAGFPVAGYDPAPGAADKCQKVVEANLATLLEFGALGPEQATAATANITYTNDLQTAVAGAQIIVEAAPENRAIKRELFAAVAGAAPAQSLVLSNTSTLNIYQLIPEALAERAIIAHWFSPPHILPLVEVVKGPDTAPQTTSTTLALLKLMGKTPVVMEKFVPGFAINRIQRIIGREVFHLLDNGYISPEDLDLAVKASLAPRMMLLGLVQRMDFTGLDLSARNLLDEQFFDPPLENRPPCLHEKLERGELGVKTGKGFFDYSHRDLPELLADRDRHLLKIMAGVEFCLKNGRLL